MTVLERLSASTYVCDAAEAQTLVAKLAGQSLKAQVIYNISIRNSYGLPLSINVTLDLRVYFSSKGRLFNYFAGQQASGGSYADKRITPDVPMHDPEMGVEATWHTGTNDLTRTIDFGNLRQIYRVNISGIAPSLSCEVLFVFNKKGMSLITLQTWRRRSR